MQTQITRYARIITFTLALTALFVCACAPVTGANIPHTADMAQTAAKEGPGATPASYKVTPRPAPAPSPTLRDKATQMINEPITMLINYDHTLEADYVPDGLVYIKNRNPSKVKIKKTNMRANEEAWETFNTMIEAAAQEGVTGFYLQSIYRSYSEQKSAFNKKVKRTPGYGEDPDEPLVTARAGTSEHQSGLAFDITAVDAREMIQDFENTEQGMWLIKNSYKYGFILRYPRGKEHITKIIYEPWHYRYVGVELAWYLEANDIVMEEFYAI